MCINAIRSEIDGLQCKYLRDDMETNPQCLAKLKQCDIFQLGLLYRSILIRDATFWRSSINAINDAIQELVVLDYSNSVQTSFAALYCINCGRAFGNPASAGGLGAPLCHCLSYNYMHKHCSRCGVFINNAFSSHICDAQLQALSQASNTHLEKHRSKCSWVPVLKRKMNRILSEVEGLRFFEFPSRTWN
jgi:hypothetical protein